MKIYNYDKQTKEFLNESEARINPKEVGEFLIPAHATTKEPLNPKDGYAVCFMNNEWEYAQDNRNKIYYENNEKVIFDLGNEITQEMNLSQYSDDELFEQEQTKRVLEIDTKTGDDIELIVGDNNKQKDLLALSTALTRKESKGTATSEEIAILNDLEQKNLEVQALKVSGNDREAQVLALTLEDFASLDSAILAIGAI